MNVFCLVVPSERIRSLVLFSERSYFFCFCFRGQGPRCNYLFYSLAPDFQTITTFCSFIQIQRNQRPLVRYDPLYPVKQHKHVFEILKFELDHI